MQNTQDPLEFLPEPSEGNRFAGVPPPSAIIAPAGLEAGMLPETVWLMRFLSLRSVGFRFMGV